MHKMNYSVQRCFFLMIFLLGVLDAHAGEETMNTSPKLSMSGYLESYYNQDHTHPSTNKKPSFVYSHNQTDRPQINLALIKASIDSANYRARLGLGSGTYMRSNYALEADGIQHIYEANVGVRLSDQHEVWLDVGVMPSHIGFESAVGTDNWTLTRSMMADNSPYFETGAKVSYVSSDGKWYVSGLLVNGWQRIRRPDGNSTPAIGHQITYRPTEVLTINSSSFIGNDKSDEERQMRYFHNLYLQMQLSSQWLLMTGFDIGAEQRLDDKGRYNIWYSPIIMTRYQLTEQLSMSIRAEYYQDKHGVIVSADTPNGFRTEAYSINLDYKPHPTLTLRGEIKQARSRDPVFLKGDTRYTDQSLTFTTALAVSF